MDEKWKLSKKSSRSASRREQPSIATSAGPSSSGSYLKRSSSMPDTVKSHRHRPPPPPSSSAAEGGPSSPQSFSRRCANLAKERRAKFYIIRRCVTMLMCWRDYPWFIAPPEQHTLLFLIFFSLFFLEIFHFRGEISKLVASMYIFLSAEKFSILDGSICAKIIGKMGRNFTKNSN